MSRVFVEIVRGHSDGESIAYLLSTRERDLASGVIDHVTIYSDDLEANDKVIHLVYKGILIVAEDPKDVTIKNLHREVPCCVRVEADSASRAVELAKMILCSSNIKCFSDKFIGKWYGGDTFRVWMKFKHK